MYNKDYECGEEVLIHYGTAHQGYTPHSGRYKWGSGKNSEQRHGSFLSKCNELKKEGFTDKQMAEYFKISTAELKAKRAEDAAAVQRGLHEAVYRIYDAGITSPTEIGKKLAINESTVRGYLKNRGKAQYDILENTKKALKEAVEKDKYIDVGKGVGIHMGVTDDRIKKVCQQLKGEGYTLESIDIPRATGNNYTTTVVLASPGTMKSDIVKNISNIKLPFKYTENDGETFIEKEPITNISSKRIYIRYPDEGGGERDGTIELRRGVEDLSLGKNLYAQVRIGVDDKYYLKGMAVYRDDIPEGYDVVFNTTKGRGKPLAAIFKPQEGVDENGERIRPPSDPSNPFGASLKDDDKLSAQRHYVGSDGKEHLSAINFVKEEGDVATWKKGLPSQILSKQSPKLAKQQLDLDRKIRQEQFDEIMKLTNPMLKAKLLLSFSDECDGAAVELKAASLPRQRTKLILPVTSLSDTEIYAPDYKDGEEVVLFRYPHGGIFEIPRLRVNNKNKEGVNLMGNAKDAVGINSRVAQQLSGADFDGDTVVVIPTKGVNIKSLPSSELKKDPYKSLLNFDNKSYKIDNWDDVDDKGRYNGHKVYTNKQGFPTLARNQSCGNEMGVTTNLIQDMTIKGATPEELVRATKYSQVVIDAYKHGLDFYKAQEDFAIHALKEKYQKQDNGKFGGSSTIITKMGSPIRVEKRLTYYKIDPETGEKIWGKADESKSKGWKKTEKKDGTVTWKEVVKTTETTKGAEMDPYNLVSGGKYEIEMVYADYATKMKQMANDARLASINVPAHEYNASAAKVYSGEVDSLKKKVEMAKVNAPLERRAQILVQKTVEMRKYDNPDLINDYNAMKKIKNQAIIDARRAVGAKKELVNPTEKEWEAIQAGAINKTLLKDIIDNSDENRLKELAMPRTKETYSDDVKAKIHLMDKQGFTISEIAERLKLNVDKVSEII